MTNPLPATPDPQAGHPVMQMLDVAMSSIIGDYDDADLVPEWQWLKQVASHEHIDVKDDSAYEYTLKLAMGLDAIPSALQSLLTAAQRLNKEVKHRSNVVGIFPNEDSIMRLLGAVLTEQNEEWLLQNRYLPQQSMAEINRADEDVTEALPLSA